ncbi:UNVERIFIED_CONTAM: Pentatricopeptide repeat-containing protein [Sesamum latifolium]|uniref:Pentatricopeptide repeat-containing protein n=1 Tax=Sesamum latifolium TaxID=2727402 RepID=A0AAW2X815_9LAMI
MPPARPQKASSIATLLVQKCAATNSLREARQLHAILLASEFTPTQSLLFIHNNLLSMYARCGSFVDSQLLFDKMPRRNVVSYNALISAYSRSPHHAHVAFRVFDHLESESLAPNGTISLFAAAGLEDLVAGSSLHALCVKIGFLDNVRVQTSLLGMYSNCGDVGCAKKVFSEMVDKDAIAWNSIISEDYDSGKRVHAQVLLSGTCIDLPLQNSLLDMYCSCGDTHTAFNVFLRIENPDLVSWNSMIGGYSENGDGEKAMDMFVQLRRVSSLKPDEYTLAAVISGTSGFPACDYGKPLHAQTEKTGLARSVYIGSILISMYFGNDDSVSSQKIFNSFLHKDAVLWTDMIAGHVRIGETEGALKFFHEMSKEVKTGNVAEVCVCSSLVDMYAKNGELKAATNTFSCLPKCDLMCWNSMLTGYGNHGKPEEAFQIFFKMLKHGLRPDQVTFLSLLAACCHCGLVEKCRLFWNYMKEYGLTPGPKHYSCMISLLSRAGLWEEAEEIIIESPFVDGYLELWRTVLSSCLKSGNLEVGIHAAEQILNMNAEDCATSILLTKLYAVAGRWNDVSEARRRMRKI